MSDDDLGPCRAWQCPERATVRCECRPAVKRPDGSVRLGPWGPWNLCERHAAIQGGGSMPFRMVKR